MGVGALQLMLDRGQTLDWFSSREIIVEAVLAGLGLYLFVVHMFTAERPFLPPGLFKDRNFVCGVTMVFCTATVMLASSALMAPYLESLAGYPVETAGLSMAPRGIGTMIGMQIASRLSNLFDHRKLMAVGLLTLGFALYSMSSWTPDVSQHQMMLTLMLQGFAIGFVFNPMTVMAFTTLPRAAARLCHVVAGAVPQYGPGGGRVGHLVDAGAQHADVARRYRRRDHAVRPRAAGQRRGVAHAGSGDAAWRGDAGPDDQPSGADHRLQQRFSHDDPGGGAAAAVAAVMRKHERRPVVAPAAGD